MKPAEFILFKLKAPIIVHPSWPDIPGNLKEGACLHRLLKVEDDGMAVDYEVMVYLHTASLAAPLSRQHYNIYAHIFGKYFGDKLPSEKVEFERLSTLLPDDERELTCLKRWIYNKQLKEWKARRKS